MAYKLHPLNCALEVSVRIENTFNWPVGSKFYNKCYLQESRITNSLFAQQSVLGLKIKLALYGEHAASNKHSVLFVYPDESISLLISKSPLISGTVGVMN